MGKYVTISVPTDVKRLLEKAKGKDDWGKFLSNLYAEVKVLKGRRAFEDLQDTLTDKDLKAMLESSKEFRKRFKFR